MRTLPQLADASTDLLAIAPRLRVTINRDQASRFGITPQMIDDTLNDAYGQRQITQYFTQLNTYLVILEVAPELQDSFTSLDRIYVKSPLTGSVLPLSRLVVGAVLALRAGQMELSVMGIIAIILLIGIVKKKCRWRHHVNGTSRRGSAWCRCQCPRAVRARRCSP
jgi:multidrug efflux pump subunit AcrB